MKNQKGITLVALTITVVVLLILAGVTVSMAIGNNGVMTKASEAKEKNKIITAKDALTLTLSSIYANIYVDGLEGNKELSVEHMSATYLKNELGKQMVGYTIAEVTKGYIDNEANNIETGFTIKFEDSNFQYTAQISEALILQDFLESNK